MRHNSPIKDIVVPASPQDDRDAAQTVHAYWNELRGAETVPNRSDVNPLHFAKALDFAFILEKQPLGVAKFRMAGTHICDFLGKDVRGLPASMMVGVSQKQVLQSLIDQVFETAEPAFAVLRPNAGSAIHAKISVFPLYDDQGDLTRAIGTFQCFGYRSVTPLHFTQIEVTHVEPEMPVTIAPVAPRYRAREYSASVQTSAVAIALHDRTPRPQNRGAHLSERPYLKLVHGA